MPDLPAKPSAKATASDSPEVTEDMRHKPVARPHGHDPVQIGPYRVLEKVGEGGMGVIYKAEQRQPVRRIVALKVIKLGMDTKEVIARFDAERQALAMLSHPNVARVLDAGMTEAGRPFFAMEFVAGVPLTDYCDLKKLTTRQRLLLFIPICNAVQHAHQKGIIHRDLKPGNVLIAMEDGKPAPKVIDFGIAKATNSQLTQQTLFTQTGAMIGTPAYMSPEQAKTSGLDVDTRTDVYSLGVMLYELLTGTLPFDPEELRKAGIDGMARIIQGTEPHKPSTRITNLRHTSKPESNAEQIATRHRTDYRSLHRELRGDLDCIVLKAMEKDPVRRYQTANALAADVRRYLDDEPIAARPASATYRISKAMRRNKLAVGAGALVLVALLVGMAGVVFELIRAQHDRDRAIESRLGAERARSETVAANAFMRELLTGTQGASDSTARISDTVRRLDGGWLASQPDTVAACRIMIAHTYFVAGTYPAAQRQYTEALRVIRGSRVDDAHKLAGLALQGLGNVNLQRRDYSTAAEEFESAAVEYRLVPGGELQVASILENLATARQSNLQAALARQARSDAIKVRMTLLNNQIAARPNDALLVSERAFMFVRIGQPQGAMADFGAAARLDPTNPYYLYYLALQQLASGDEGGYRVSAGQMFAKFQQSEIRATSARVALACLLGSPPVGDVERLVRIANAAAPASDSPNPNGRWFLIPSALAEYRAGHYAAAQQVVGRARNVQGLFAQTNVEFLGAMILYKTTGNSAQARDAYRLAVQRMNTDMLRFDVNPNAVFLTDAMVCQILRKEADAMFAGKPATRVATRPGDK